MKKNLINDIKCFMELHELDTVCLFINNKYEVKSISSAYGLKCFLNDIGIKTEIIVNKPEHMKKFYTDTLKVSTSNKFLGIAIGCKQLNEIESPEYNKTYVLFNVYGPIKTRGYGVINYTENNVSSTAEIIFDQIYEYANENNIEISQTVAQHLYTALVAGSKRYGSNVKPNTFEVAKKLIELNANYVQANYLVERKNPVVLEIQEAIFKYMVRKSNIMYAIIPIGVLNPKITHDDVFETLDMFKKIDKIDMWIIFIQRDNGYYSVSIQSKAVNPYSAKAVAVRNNGVGNKLQAKCIVLPSDINKVLREAKEEIIKDRTNEKNDPYDEENEEFD